MNFMSTINCAKIIMRKKNLRDTNENERKKKNTNKH